VASTWLEAIAEHRQRILAQHAHEDAVADGLQGDPAMEHDFSWESDEPLFDPDPPFDQDFHDALYGPTIPLEG
jgi:hypothetical protein